MPSTDDEIQLWYYTSAEGVLPSASRFPWLAAGGGGTLTAKGVLIAASGATKAFLRQTDRPLTTDRIDVQLRFAGLTDAPTWASVASGHILSIDDGQRVLNVSIGTTIRLVEEITGTVLYEIPQDQQPGGWVEPRYYLLVKDGETAWELSVDGRLVFRLPYQIAARSTDPADPPRNGLIGFGWGDATVGSSGSALWDEVEVGINAPIPPRWVVDRVRNTMPVFLQDQWTARHEALLRAMVGLGHQARDKMARTHREFTAAVIPIQRKAFSGERSVLLDGWATSGDGTFENVRGRLRIGPSALPTWAQADFDPPVDTDGVFRVASRFILRDLVTTDPQGRAGPFLAVSDGNIRVFAILRVDLANPQGFGWLLCDDPPGSPSLGNRGDVVYRVDPRSEAYVELYLIGRERVILFVDGELVEDLPYDRFTADATDEYSARIGRDGSATITCTADFTDGEASIAHGDNAYRPLFLRRVAERLLFASGCERNDVLDAWLRHRHGVFSARGTDRVLSEIRRLSCDDTASLVATRFPGDWFVGVTYPGVTPVFVNPKGDIPDVVAEYRGDHAPNFTPAQLERLISWYLLPRSTREARFRSRLVTDLTSDPVTAFGVSTFTVASLLGFDEGDAVTLRGTTTDTLLTLTYDADEGLTDLSPNELRDFSGNARTGVLTGGGANATIGNEDRRNGVVIQADAGAGLMEGVRSPAFIPAIATGFTVVGWFRYDLAHDGTLWLLGQTQNGVGVGGYKWAHLATGELQGSVFSAGGSRVVTSAPFAPAADTWVHLALRWDDVANVLSIWMDGVLFASSAAGAFTMIDPPSDKVGFGGPHTLSANLWKGRHRDHSLYSRTLTGAEILELYEDTIGRGGVREDADLELLYLPTGWTAIAATHDDATHGVAADFMSISSFGGDVWADWELISQGTANDEIGGLFTVPGLDGDRLDDVTPGGSIVVRGVTDDVVVLVEVFGIETGTGNAVSYRVQVNGTADVAIPGAWASVHGAICTPAAQDMVQIEDVTTGDTLYEIDPGERASGCYLFDPAVFAGPARVRVVANGATTATILLAGNQEGLADRIHGLALTGTTPVTVPYASDDLRVIAAGYLSAARSIALSAVFCDPLASLQGVSTSASDVQRARVFVLKRDGTAAALLMQLDGTTPVIRGASAGNWHVLGVELLSPAVGTVSFTLTGGSHTDILFATFPPGATVAGIDRRRIESDGNVAARMSAPQVSTRYLAIFGRDENGDVAVEAVPLDGTAWTWTSLDFDEILGVATGHLGETRFVQVSGHAWRYRGARPTVRGLAGSAGWIAQGPAALALDGVLLDSDPQDATLGPVALDGEWSTTENTSITTLDRETLEVTTPGLAETFVLPTVMRKREPA